MNKLKQLVVYRHLTLLLMSSAFQRCLIQKTWWWWLFQTNCALWPMSRSTTTTSTINHEAGFISQWRRMSLESYWNTRCSAMAEGPRDASWSYQLLHNCPKNQKSHLKRLAISERPCGHSRRFEMPRFDKRYITSYYWSAVTTSVVHYLWDIGTSSNDLEWLWRSLWLSEAFLIHIHCEIGSSTCLQLNRRTYLTLRSLFI